MTRIQKLTERLMSCPSTFEMRDLVRVMASYGFSIDEKGKTSGSRMRFYRECDGRMLLLHTPHPSNSLKAGTIRNVVSFLRELDDE